VRKSLCLPDRGAAPKDWRPPEEQTGCCRHILEGGNPLPPGIGDLKEGENMRTTQRYSLACWITMSVLALLAMPVFAGTVVSQANGLWAAPATWSPGVPGTGDDVFIAAGHTVTLTNMPAVVVNSLSVSGLLTHVGNTTTFKHRVNLQIGGDLTVAAGGRIDVTAMGYTNGYGPGTPGGNDRRSGASHGGKGAQGATTTTWPGETYDSVIAPTNLGSGGVAISGVNSTCGGGAVLLNVGRTTRIDGLIVANGTNGFGTANSGGAGGSVYLTTSNLLGGGLVQANGGLAQNNNGSCGGGGGGRIAVVLTGSASFDSVALQAFGGTNLLAGDIDFSGAAGTVYRRTQNQGTNEGALIIANNGVNGNRKTEISSNVTDASVGDVIIRDAGTLVICTNQSLVVNGSFSNGYAFVAQPGSTLQFGGTNPATIYGSQTNANLVCTNAGKTLLFQAGRTNTVEEGLTFKGDALAKLVLRSSADGTQWRLSVKGSALQTVDYVDVKDSKANVGYAAPITATHSMDSSNNVNWSFTEVGLTNTWQGASNSTWSVATNWSLGRAPIGTDVMVLIPGGKVRYPALDTERDLSALTMETGSAFTLNGQNLRIIGDAAIGGALTASGAELISFFQDVDFTGGAFTQAQSTVIIGGTNAQSITSAGQAFYRLTVTNTQTTVTFADAVSASQYRSLSASVSFGGNLAAGSFWVYSDGGAVTQTFASGAAYGMDELYFMGTPGKTQYLRSSGAGAWLLNVSNVVYVKCVDVQNSDASGGRTINALGSADGGGNPNWVFNTSWKVWTGATSASFTNDANWSPSGAPTATDYVLIDDPHRARIATPVTVYRLVLGGSTQATLEANAPLTVVEDAQVLAGGALTHTNNTTTAAYRLSAVVSGRLTVATGGSIDANGKGYASGYGPGAPAGAPTSSNKRSGAGHGGRGGMGDDLVDPGKTYGSIIAPTNLGSGGSYYSSPGNGGGAVLLTVGGVTRVDGLITANGTNELVNANGAGSGGSVYLTTSNLVGSGTIQANGGIGYFSNGNSGSGGGGRVAVVLTGSGDFGSVTLRALGVTGSFPGAAGTVYKRTQGQGPNEGTLVVDNNGVGANRNTDISASVTDTAVGDVIIRGSAVLQLNTNQSLTVNGSFSNGNAFVAEPGSTLQLGGSNAATVYGSQTFASLVCTNAGKTLLFEAGRTNTVLDGLTLKGDATADLVLRSSQDGVQWRLSVTNAAAQHVEYVDVRDSKADVGFATQIRATYSTNSGNNVNWSFAEVGVVDTWIGTSNTAWTVAANWDLGRAPLITDSGVVISNGCPNYPLLDTARELPPLTLMPGSVFNLNGQNLTVAGDAVFGGTLTAAGTETLTLLGNADFTGGSFVPANSTVTIGGSNAQSFVSAGERFHSLTVSNTTALVSFVDAMAADYYRSISASVSYGGGVTAMEFRVLSDGSAVTQTFAVGAAYSMDYLYLQGSAGHTQVLQSAGGGAWRLNVGTVAYARAVQVSDSDASGGLTVYPIDSQDGGGNSNWVFDAVWKAWTGAADTNFGNGSNWSPSGAPAASDFVLIDTPNPAVLGTPTTVCRIILGGTTTATLRANALLTVLEDLQVLPGGVLTHGSNTTVSTYKLTVSVASNLTVAAGGSISAESLGFNGDYGTGAGTDSGGGGSYGGQGGYGRDAGQAPGPTYGSIVAPTNLGSGGAVNSGSPSGNGGGAIRLTVGGATRIDGTVSANGKSTTANQSGGGSGGSLWLTAGSLLGSGTVRANGGNATYGSGDVSGGGGGRIAVRLTGADAFGNVVLQAYGGTGTRDCGAAGTIYLEGQSDVPGQGRLIVDNAGRATVLGEVTDLSGVAAVSFSPRDLSLRNAGVVGIGADDTLTLTNTVLAGDATGGQPGIRLRGGQFIVPASFTFSNLLVAVDAAGSVFSPASSLVVAPGAVLEINAPHVIAGSVTLPSGTVMQHKNNATTEAYKIDLTVLGNLTVESGARIDVAARGYQSASGLGASILVPADGSIKRSGGSYGGKGAQGTHSLPGLTYGAIIAPTNLGSGGSSHGLTSGGGAVRLTVSGTTRVDGLITADGTNTSIQANGGGSGGSVWLTTGTLLGSGTIQANGARGWNDGLNCGSGGGGRIAVILTGSGDFGGVGIQARGGANGAYSGGAGTVYRATASQGGGRGTVMVDNDGMVMNGYAELPGQLSPSLSNELDHAILVLTNTNTRLALTAPATVGNLVIYTNAYLALGSWDLTVNSAEHPLGSLVGWGPGATNRVDHYSQILWNPTRGTIYGFR
jgi:hypothetical protein